MIHEFTEPMLQLPLSEHILTFDDGLYGQYWYWREHLKNIPVKKYFFISTGIVCPEDGWQDDHFYSSPKAHAKARDGDFSNYMKLSQIKELMQDPWVTIGGHGHNHLDLGQFATLLGKVNYIREDTKQMLEWFQENLNFKPTHFAYPHNDSVNEVYTAYLKSVGFTDFYGYERTPVERLLYERGLPETLYTPDIAALT